MFVVCCVFVCFKQRTAYEMRISDWSSDVCSSDLLYGRGGPDGPSNLRRLFGPYRCPRELRPSHQSQAGRPACRCAAFVRGHHHVVSAPSLARRTRQESGRSEEHTSELQSLMRISYAVFCLKKKQKHDTHSSIRMTTER